jgi:hypothetical protein
MVKSARLPPRRIVTTGAVSSVFASCELSRVRVLVTAEAILGSRAEIDVFQIGLECRTAMAVGTGHAAVRPDERKSGFRMVKAVQLFPLGRGVAGFATCNRLIAFTNSRTEVFAKSTYVKRMSGLTQINKALITSNRPHRVLYAA